MLDKAADPSVAAIVKYGSGHLAAKLVQQMLTEPSSELLANAKGEMSRPNRL